MIFPAQGWTVSQTPEHAAYLQRRLDQNQETIDLYTAADAAGNHFAARGEFDTPNAGAVPAMDQISTTAPCLNIPCITATFDPRQRPWAGGTS
jgi:hypothetical protein